MALGYERSHAEFFSKNDGLEIVVFRLPIFRGIFVSYDLSES